MKTINSYYYAPKPDTSWVKWLIMRVFFPPILLWDIAKWAVNGLIGKYVGWLILPASFTRKIMTKEKKDEIGEEIEILEKEWGFRGKRYTVMTHDEAELETLEIKSKAVLATPTKYIIYFPQNNENCMQSSTVGELSDDANSLNCTVIGFNYRGVHRSQKSATSAQDLVTDGIAQVQRLLQNGVGPENIVLKGSSLGGGIATLVAKHFHDNGKKIKLFNNQSFSSLTNLAIGQVRNFFDVDMPVIGTLSRGVGILLGWVFKPIVKFLLTLTKWEIDAGDAYKALPETHKEYVFLRKKEGKQREKEAIQLLPSMALYIVIYGQRDAGQSYN